MTLLGKEAAETKKSFPILYLYLRRTKDLDLPESYKSNTPKEKVLLKYAENFQRQFKQLYADRKRLLLSPPNECGIEVSGRFVQRRLMFLAIFYTVLLAYVLFAEIYLHYIETHLP